MEVKDVQELLDQAAIAAQEDAITRICEDKFADSAVRAVYNAGWKDGEAEGFRSGYEIGSRYLSNSVFVLILALTAVGFTMLGAFLGEMPVDTFIYKEDVK